MIILTSAAAAREIESFSQITWFYVLPNVWMIADKVNGVAAELIFFPPPFGRGKKNAAILSRIQPANGRASAREKVRESRHNLSDFPEVVTNFPPRFV